jgi:hypothetical protein
MKITEFLEQSREIWSSERLTLFQIIAHMGKIL